jgi:soluble lytic murein transglycosylase-like protein
MDRSPARPIRIAAAAAGYVAFWGLLAAIATPTPSEPVTIRTAAAHAPGAVVPWAAVGHRVYEEVDRRMRKLGVAHRSGVARTILEEAARAAMDPLLVLAVIQIESGFDPHAVSPVGAAGLMQLLAPTMREELARWRLGAADPFDPVANVRAGVRYLDRMLHSFHDLELALMAYNAGPARIRRHLRDGGVPERFLSYPRGVATARERLSAAFASAGDALTRAGHALARAGHAPPSLLAAHAANVGPAGASRAGGIASPSAPGELPIAKAAAPIAAAVPAGSRRRDRTDT